MMPGLHTKRPRKGGTVVATTMAASLAAALLAGSARAQGHTWPSARYREDPVAFSRQVVGIEPWSRQAEILEAIRDYPRVTIRSGHRVSKSCTLAIAALWFYCSFEDARVFMTSTTARQVEEILWRELSIRHARARIPIGGTLGKLSRTGLRDGFREIVGFTANQTEAVGGLAGENIIFLVDEASGVDQAIFTAIEGNRAGGARVVYAGNPTRNEGEFYDSHNSKREFFHCIHVSSEDTPNVKTGRKVIPGLADRPWVEEKRAEWGEASALYQVRVRGDFPHGEADKVVALHLVTDAEERWEDTKGEGRLNIGADPAGEGDDHFGLCARRGRKVLEVKAFDGSDEDAAVETVAAFVSKHRQPGEGAASVKVDVTGGSGNIGGRVAAKLRAKYGPRSDGHPGMMEIVGVDASSRSPDQRYPLMRDALWFAGRQWLRDGGALPPEKDARGAHVAEHDKKLSGELTCPGYAIDLHDRPKVDPQEKIKKAIKRSPDRANAFQLSVYEPAGTRWDDQPANDSAPSTNWYDSVSSGEIDPYASLIDGGFRG